MVQYEVVNGDGRCNYCGAATEDNLCGDCALWLWDQGYDDYAADTDQIVSAEEAYDWWQQWPMVEEEDDETQE